MSSNNKRQLMADAKFYEAYSRFNDSTNKYESWSESVSRVMNMHRDYLSSKGIVSPILSDLINEVEEAYSNKLILGAQRALQFGGDQLLKHQARMYNCSASYCDRPEFFGEAFYLMLCGCGVGFSVQSHHIAKLPKLAKRANSTAEFVIPDSIEGWAEAVDVLFSSFFVGGGKHPEYEGKKIYFNLEKIRPKGSFISGGFKAPGPEGLRLALDKIEHIIKTLLESGRDKLKPIEAYDIVMYIADAVISGGVRRSATICLFSSEDEEMMKAKTGDWYTSNPQRGRSNNSCVLIRSETTEQQLQDIMHSVQHSGEPGFIFSENKEALYNPCVEIGMYGYSPSNESGFQFCNLTEINGAASITPEIFYHQCKVAAILGTIQASYTDFKFVSKATKDITEREALIGVGITGWMNNPEVLFNVDVMKQGAEISKYWNKVTAELININQAARVTCVKPSGNASVLLGCASGIHGEHSPQYIRHVQMNKESEIAQLFMKNFPEMCEDSVWSKTDIVIGFPVVSPENSIYKSDLLGIKQLEYVKLAQDVWIEEGTNYELCVQPWLRHNVSNTITVDDWDAVTNYVYANRNSFCGISFLSAAGDRAYPQAPFTEVHTYQTIIDLYGEPALFTSALITAGLEAFNNDLWTAINTALGYGEQLNDSHEHLLKRDFVRRFNKYATNFKSSDECANCLKDVYNLHKWWRVAKTNPQVDWSSLGRKAYTDINTTGAQGCSGGACEITF